MADSVFKTIFGETLDTLATPSASPRTSTFEANVIPPVTSPNALVAPKPAVTKTGNKAQEIEQASDFYVPSLYQLLGFYSNFRADDDSNTSFIPVTQAKANSKLFVVGIIPPSANITGKLLDRSATIADLTAPPADGTDRVDVPIARTFKGVSIPEPSPPGTTGAYLPDTFWHKYVLMCQRLKVDPVNMAAVLHKESRFDPRAVNQKGQNLAQGLCQFVRKTGTGKTVGMSPTVWNQFGTMSAEAQLYYVEKFYAGKVAGATKARINEVTVGSNSHTNPDGSMYASKEAQAKWVAAHPEDAEKFLNPADQDRAVTGNPQAAVDGIITADSLASAGQLDRRPPSDILNQIRSAQTFLSRNNISPFSNPPTPTPEQPANFQGKGSTAASDAKKNISKTADTSQAQIDLAGQLRTAQQTEIDETLAAINQLKNTPPLRLLVNPNSFKISSEKIISDGNWTRNGPIVEHWGDNQDKIEASGKVAAFFAIDAESPSADAKGEGPGLTRGARNYSAGYQNFLSLYLLYRNNANVYTTGLPSKDSKSQHINRLSMLGSMYIYYDDTLYIGSFDNFNITESETAPYTLEYNYQFTVRATFLLDNPPPLSVQGSQFTSRRMVLPTSSTPTGNEDFSSVALPPGTGTENEAATPQPPEEQLFEDLVEEDLRKELGL